MTDAVSNTNEYKKFLQIIKDKNIKVVMAKDLDKLDIDSGWSMNFFWPKESYIDKNIDNLNNTSIVCQMTYGNIKYLFTGDAEKEVQDKLNISIGTKLKSDILKVAHHGSTNGTEETFSGLVNPELNTCLPSGTWEIPISTILSGERLVILTPS